MAHVIIDPTKHRRRAVCPSTAETFTEVKSSMDFSISLFCRYTLLAVQLLIVGGRKRHGHRRLFICAVF